MAELKPPLFCKAEELCFFFIGNINENVKNTSVAVKCVLLPWVFKTVNLLQCPYVISSVWDYWKI